MGKANFYRCGGCAGHFTKSMLTVIGADWYCPKCVATK